MTLLLLFFLTDELVYEILLINLVTGLSIFIVFSNMKQFTTNR